MRTESSIVLAQDTIAPYGNGSERISALLGLIGDLDLEIISIGKVEDDSSLRGAVA